MKKLCVWAVAALLMAACTPKAEKATDSGLLQSNFRTEVDGKKTDLYILRNKNNMEVCITNFGGRIVSVMVPDKDGQMRDVVLGFDSIQDYISKPSDFGASIGRYANRIYDFNRKDANGKTRELHTDLAREAINYEVLDDYRTKYEPLKDEPVELVACPYFTTSLYDMTEEISCDYSELDSFVIFICMEGSCKMVDNEGNELTVNAGESILLPATTQDITITPESANVKLLETYV